MHVLKICNESFLNMVRTREKTYKCDKKLFVCVSVLSIQCIPCHSIPNQTKPNQDHTRYNTKATWPKIPSISRMRHIATFQMMKSVADYTGKPSFTIYAWLLNENFHLCNARFGKVSGQVNISHSKIGWQNQATLSKRFYLKHLTRTAFRIPFNMQFPLFEVKPCKWNIETLQISFEIRKLKAHRRFPSGCCAIGHGELGWAGLGPTYATACTNG